VDSGTHRERGILHTISVGNFSSGGSHVTPPKNAMTQLNRKVCHSINSVYITPPTCFRVGYLSSTPAFRPLLSATRRSCVRCWRTAPAGSSPFSPGHVQGPRHLRGTRAAQERVMTRVSRRMDSPLPCHAFFSVRRRIRRGSARTQGSVFLLLFIFLRPPVTAQGGRTPKTPHRGG